MKRSATAPEVADLALVGGGHSHALLLRMLAMDPVPGLRVTLISDVSHAPYSGMLPGLVAGLYTFDEAHIDLRRLATLAGAAFVHAAVTGVDTKQRLVHCDGAGRPPLRYDVLSLNVGSRPAPTGVPGALEHAIPAKPVPRLIAAIEALATRIEGASSASSPSRVTLVGGGAGGTELALALTARFGARLALTLIHEGPALVPSFPASVRAKLEGLLRTRGASLVLGQKVVAVDAGTARLASGTELAHDLILWITTPSPQPWLAQTGLELDAHGFLRVRATLQTPTHPEVFAAGDCATIDAAPRDKSGVYAVRHARPLSANLRRFLRQEPCVAFRPQRRYLSLVGTGDRRAIGARPGGLLAVSGAWVWSLKDRIDRAFMDQFAAMTPATMRVSPVSNPLAQVEALTRRRDERCAGCAAKVGADVLGEVLGRLDAATLASYSGVPAGRQALPLPPRDDAALVSVPAGMQLVQSVDYLTELVSDPYVFGQIAAHHAFSDVFAMGASPHSALALVHAPLAAKPQMTERLYQMLAGVAQATEASGALLIGGHTGEGAEAGIGLTVNGVVREGAALRKGGARIGDALVVTKALGIGTIFAAAMRAAAKGAWIDAAVASMLVSNRGAAEILRAFTVHALTDVTGFGLAGHLGEMLRASGTGCGAALRLASLPILPGARETAQRGILSTLHPHNLAASSLLTYRPALATTPEWPLLFDPQTSGGLLAAVPAGEAESLVAALRVSGLASATIIGTVCERDPQLPTGGGWIDIS